MLVLDKLEQIFARQRGHGEALYKWARDVHGITELPAMKHVAAFRPLQLLVQEDTSFKRLPIISDLMNSLGLESFHGKERVHLYSCREPSRIEEKTAAFLQGAQRDARGSPTPVGDVNEAILQRFIVRGLLLINTAHLAGISLSKRGASPLYRRNASPLDFFDFGGAEEVPQHELAAHKQDDFDSFANTIRALAFRLAGKHAAGFRAPLALRELVKSAVETSQSSLSEQIKIRKLEEKIRRIVRFVQKQAERER